MKTSLAFASHRAARLDDEDLVALRDADAGIAAKAATVRRARRGTLDVCKRWASPARVLAAVLRTAATA